MSGMSTGLFFIGLLCITIAGCFFLLWPRQIKLLALRYNFHPYKREFFWSYYLLGVWPFFQSVLILLLPSSNEKAFVLVITCIIILCQCLVIIWDRVFLEKVNYTAHLTKQQMKNIDKMVIRAGIPNVYGMIASLAMLIHLGNWWTNQEMGNMLGLLLPACAAFYTIITGMGVLLVRWTRRQSR